MNIQFPLSIYVSSYEIYEHTPLFSALAHKYGVLPLSGIIALEIIFLVFLT